MGPTGTSSRVDVPETRWARTVDGACIAYQDIGEGPVTLLVVHGWVSHLEVYWEQPRYVRFLRRLSRNMRVLVFDKRGIGMSDRVAGAPDLGVLLDDVRAVMDAAGVESAALLGWGGPGPELAAFFAATYPERTVCFTLFGDLHYRQEPDYPWGETPEEFEEGLARIIDEPGGATPGRWSSCAADIWQHGGSPTPHDVASRRRPGVPEVEREAGTLLSDARELRGVRRACGTAPTYARRCAPISVADRRVLRRRTSRKTRQLARTRRLA